MAPLAEKDPYERDVNFLDQYSQERWDTVLHYLVGSSQQSGVSLDAVKILLHSGLMTTDPEDPNQHHITKSGFQFLLMETSSQVSPKRILRETEKINKKTHFFSLLGLVFYAAIPRYHHYAKHEPS